MYIQYIGVQISTKIYEKKTTYNNILYSIFHTISLPCGITGTN